MDSFLKKEVIEYLSSFVTKERLEIFQKKIRKRSRYLTIVLEDVFQSRNISAAMRTADCFGLQDIHIIENKNKFVSDKNVSLGAGEWLSIFRHNEEKNNTITCIKNLKNQGYQIIATTPHKADITLEEVDIVNNKIAILFGTELTGLSYQSLNLADKKMNIEMHGFTESLNISVSAAICCQYLSHKMRKSAVNWQIKKDEKNDIILSWLRKTIKSSEKIEERFLKKNGNL
tara:strand:- start:635 stop:1324 length:690 start_codon:yes stop_codon:yes gene_type:complete